MIKPIHLSRGFFFFAFIVMSYGILTLKVVGPPVSDFKIVSNQWGEMVSVPQDKKPLVYDGIENSEWCMAPTVDPLPYEQCKFDNFVFRLAFNGGLTNAFGYVLKGALWAYEIQTCFFVDEQGEPPFLAGAQVGERNEPLERVYPFIERYFEPIGLPPDHPKVRWARENRKFTEPDSRQINLHEYGMTSWFREVDDPRRHRVREIQPLDVYNKDNIWTKKWFLRRLFRILPEVRSIACSRLSKYNLQNEYITLSIRRGDKIIETEISPLQPYIDAAEEAIQTHFEGRVPIMFVASDDCSVMNDLRTLRPQWVLVGECDDASEENGFTLTNMRDWSLEQTDNHYYKFITEMIAMASAKYFIGVSSTNVSLWIYFMRSMDATDDTFKYVDNNLYPW